MDDKRHFHVIENYNRKLTVIYKNVAIAKTTAALSLKEVAKKIYDPVFYIPKDDILIALELESERQSHCPIKGDATYWNVKDDYTDNYFAWSYEGPFPRSKKIKGYIAFNMEYVTFISEPI